MDIATCSKTIEKSNFSWLRKWLRKSRVVITSGGRKGDVIEREGLGASRDQQCSTS